MYEIDLLQDLDGGSPALYHALAGEHDANTAVSRMRLVSSSGIKQGLVDGLTICYFRLRYPMAN